MSGTALYVYAIIPANGDLPGLTGIEGRPVRLIEAPSGLAALVHDAEPIPFQGADEQVKGWIVEHSNVVDHAWEALGTVLPVTVNVIVKGDARSSAEERLRAWLEQSEASLRQRLDALRDRVELRVEVALDRGEAARSDPESAALRAELAEKPPGLRRLLERKLEQSEKWAVERLADRQYPDLRRRIATHAEDLVENRRTRPAAGLVPVLSLAVLVQRQRIEALGTELAQIQTELPEARIRFLGPWPPYSFAEVSDAIATGEAREAASE
ncbi:MAG: GvpL/GvpF family gas vesicle protein [Thermoanaerobaculia bacterium]